MIGREVVDTTGDRQRSKRVLLRKASRISLKAFAIFATAMILLSAFVIADIEYNIDIPDDLPWDYTYYPGPLGNYARLNLKNASADVPIVVRFENVTASNTTLVKDGVTMGEIEPSITNFYIFTVENGTEPYLRFWVTDGVYVRVEKIDKSLVEDINKSHVFGDTFHEMGGKYIADLGFESLEAKNVTVTSSGNLTYIGIIEYPAFVDSICRYGWINETTTSFNLPAGTKTLRLVSDDIEDFDMDIIPIEFEGVAVIDVIATRQFDGAVKYVRTITATEQYYGFDMSVLDSAITVAADNSTIFTMVIENTGNGNDTIDLEVSGDWDTSFIDSDIEIGFNETGYAQLVVTAPSGSEGQNKTIQINATSRGNQSKKSSLNVTLFSKSPSFSFDFNCSEPTKEVYPKQSVWYYFTINNSGNVEDTFDLELLDPETNWSYVFDENPVRVDSNTTTSIQLIVTPPLITTNGSYSIMVNLTSRNNTNNPQSANLTAIVVRVAGVDLSPDYQLKNDCPKGTEVTFPVIIQNAGNSPDTISLSITDGQADIKDENGTIISSVSLGPYEGRTIYLYTDTANSNNKERVVTFKGTSQVHAVYTETVTVKTTTIAKGGSPNGDGDDWHISAPMVVPGKILIPVENNEQLSFSINITNKGDQPDNFTITKSIEYSNLTQALFDMIYNETRNELILNQSTSDMFHATLDIPQTWHELPGNDSWNLETYGFGESDPTRVYLDVNESQTLFLNITVPNNAPLGESSKVTIKLNSTGDSDAVDVNKKYFWILKPNTTESSETDFEEIFPYGVYPQLSLDAKFSISCAEPLSTARPGNSTTYHIYISNNDDYDMDFNLSTYGVPEGWQASLDNNSISVVKFGKGEVNLTITTPDNGSLSTDQDMDGLLNTLEVNYYNTSILNPDSDSDMFWDGAEMNYWYLRGLDIENISLYLNDNDIDNDALLDGEEILYLTNINGSSDNDTLEDSFEIHQFFTYEKENINMDYYPPPPFNISIEFDIDVEDDYRLMVDILNQINTTVNDVNHTEPVVNQIMENITTVKISGEDLNFNSYGVPMTIEDMGSNNYNITDDRYYAIYKSLNPGNYNLTIQIQTDPTIYENTTIYLINVSTFQIQRHGLDPFDEDVDDDGLNDSYEVYRGINPFKVDTDEDGLSDYDEAIIYKSNPKVIDTDYDGLADGYNVTVDSVSYKGELAYGTNPTNPDSDGDGLCDGFNNTIGGIDYVGELAIGTNPNKWDTDSDTMPDGWENLFGLNPLNSNDANTDNDVGGSDNLTNAQEYTVGTDPTDNDSDDDNLDDGDEITGVLFRTNISMGADRIDYYESYYENQTGFKWIYYIRGKYEFKDAYTNETNTSSARYNGTDIVFISSLSDGTIIIYNETADEIYVWEPGADYDDSDHNGTLEGTFYAFNSSSSSEPVTTDIPEPGYKYQEIYNGTNPWINDTDEDGLFDGDEKDCLSDTDNDGIPNNLDTDSDNDDVIDGQEIGWDQNSDGDAVLYNMLDPDSDNDNISDGTEPLWYLDIDSDGLENMIDTDSDNDNLNDGVEDWNYNGTLDANETSMIDVDTDNDGIIDSVELNWNISSDNDTLINARDQDSDNDGVTDGNEVRVVFRTNAINGVFNSTTWVSLALNQSAWDSDTEPPNGYNLTGFWFNASSAEPIGIQLGYTFENEEIRYDETNNTVFVNDTRFIYNTSSQIRNSTTPTLMFTKNRGETIVFYNITDGDNLYNVLDNDSDDDNLVDGLEDLDNDGIIDMYETDPYMQDTDMDGIPDGIEDTNLDGGREANETDPLDEDSDEDGLWDGWEDIDGDKFYDPFEFGEDTNANGTVDVGETNPLVLDTDGDLLRDDFETIDDVFWLEAENYLVTGAEKNTSENASTGSAVEFEILSEGDYRICIMVKSITSGSSFTFLASNATSTTLINETANIGINYKWYNTTIFAVDTADLPITLHLPDSGADSNIRIDKIVLVRTNNVSMVNITNPSDDDSDDDGLSDANERFIYQTHPFDSDSDNDGLQDGTELGITTSQGDDTSEGFQPDEDANYTTNPLGNDTDRDGLPDGWIDFNKDGYPQPIEGEDFGCDGKVNTYNTPNGGNISETVPYKLDSDTDGINDTREVTNNVNWFEAESNILSGATIVDSDSASTGTKIIMPNPSIPNGSYMFYIMAKTIVEGTDLTFGVYDSPTAVICNKTVTLTDDYAWYNTSAFNITNEDLPIYLYAPYPSANDNIHIEKAVLICISNMTDYLPIVTEVSNSSLEFLDSGNQTIYFDIPENMYAKVAKMELASPPYPLEAYKITPGSISSEFHNKGIFDDKIVYKDFRDSNWNIYLYDIKSNTEKLITTSGLTGLSYFGNKMVYTKSWNLYMYDLDTDVERQIAPDTSNEKYPMIYQNKIVWQDSRDFPDTDTDIYMYDISKGIEIPICINNSKQEYPAIFGNRIVWQDLRNGNWDIYMYDLEAGTESQITNHTSNQTRPAIYEDKIVWYESRYGYWDIYMFDLSTGIETKITPNQSSQWKPRIYESKIVWEDSRNGNWDIYMYDLKTDIEFPISVNSSNKYYPEVYKDRVIWDYKLPGTNDKYIFSCNLTYPTNIILNANNDSDVEWYHQSQFYGQETIPNFADEINEYIFNHRKSFTDGKISVPINIFSGSIGRIDISKLLIILAPDVSCPYNNDTDSDKLLDGYEKDIYYTHSLSVDSDYDMLYDYEEIMGTDDIHRVGTHPANHDTDNDGLWDGFEDLNKNGVFDSIDEVGEDVNRNYYVDYNETNPLDPDSDNDAIPDGKEYIPGMLVFEAENYSIAQIINEENGSNGLVVGNSSGIELIKEDSFPQLPPGDYILYVRAKSNNTEVQSTEYFSSGLGDWITYKNGTETDINADSDYLKIVGIEENYAYAINTALTLPSSGDYIIKFDYRYPSGTIMDRFLIWGTYENSKPDVEIWQTKDKLYANDDPIAFASLTNTIWHHFEIISIKNDTFEIYLDGSLVYNATKVENGSSYAFGKVGDISFKHNGSGHWDNVQLVEVSHINVTVRTTSSGISWKILPVFEEYNWFYIAPFIVESNGYYEIDINDSDGSKAAAYIDKLMVFKITDPADLIVTTTTEPEDTILFSQGDNITIYLDLKVEDILPFYVVRATIDISAQRHGVYLNFNDNIEVNDDTSSNWQSMPSIAIDNNGTVFIAWSDRRDTDNNIYFTKSTDGGKTFHKNIKINDDSGSASQTSPSIALDSSDNIYITWEDYRNVDSDIYFTKSTNGGNTFSGNIQVNDDTGSDPQHSPSIAIDDVGNIFITWYDKRNGDYDIYFANSTNGGTSFGTNNIVNDDGTSERQYKPSIAAESNGFVYIVWYDYRSGSNYDVYFANSTDGGAIFSQNIKITDEIGDSNQVLPSIATEGNGLLYVAWADFRDGSYDIYFTNSPDGGASFGTNIKINDDGATNEKQTNPSVVVVPNGNIYVVWEDERYGSDYPDIFIARSIDKGKNFSENIKINDDSGSYVQVKPSIAADDSGIYVVWTDDRSDSYGDIYFSTNGKYPTYPYLNLGGHENISIPRANQNIKDFANSSLEDLINMTLPQWAWYFGEFTQENGTHRTLDITGELNRYIIDHVNLIDMVNESGYLRIPLEFHSDTPGKLIISNIIILLTPYVTDALCNDTDGDGLSDGHESLIWTSSLKWDSDNDGLWDVVEPVKGIKTDPLDSDTENDLLMDGNSDEIKVIFRSGSSYGTFINYTEGTWIACQKLIWIDELSSFVPVSEYSRLLGYGFNRNATSLPAEYASIIINTTEGYNLFYINSTSEIYVKLGENDYKVYNLSDSDSNNAENLTAPQVKYAIENREIYSNAALTADKDNDGLIDGIESHIGLTPTDADWDNDGILDGIEYYLLGTDPMDYDSDDDRLWDGLEVGITLSDVWEIRWNLEVNELILGTDLDIFTGHHDTEPNSTTDPCYKDTDKDGIWDGFNDLNGSGTIDPEEPGEDRNLNGRHYDENETNPVNPDTDGDGLTDGHGENWDGDIYLESGEKNPMDVDTDDDGLWDGYTTTCNGTLYLGELSYFTDQLCVDSDNDNIIDGKELGLYYNSSDIGNDTVFDDSEANQNHFYIKGTDTSIFISDMDPLSITNPVNNDTDEDGIEDGIEDENCNGYFENNTQETDPNNDDTDFDGITDGEEDIDRDGVFDEGTAETNANDADTDDDGIKDGSEILFNTDYDKDGLINVLDNDSDNDGLLDGVESGITAANKPGVGYGFNGTSDSYVGDMDPVNTSNPLDNDTDDDGLPDGWIDGWIYSWDYGWGNYSTVNGIMEPWEGEDFSCNGSYEPENYIDSGGVYLNETIPHIADTDGEGIPDGIEAYFDLNPLNSSDAEEDLDLDSITNLEEWRHGLDYDNDQLVNFNDTDDDNDCIDTIDEIYYEINPYYDDRDEDLDYDGLTNIYEYNNSLDLSNRDTDGDNLYDGWEDSNGNGVLDWYDKNSNDKWDEGEGEKPGESYYGTNASDEDTDDDGMWDGDEIEGWFVFVIYDIYNKYAEEYWVSSNPLLNDTDGDGLNDTCEYKWGIDPNKNDTDLDRINDAMDGILANNDTDDPTICEYKNPILTDKPEFDFNFETIAGIWVEAAYVTTTVSINDDVEIRKVEAMILDNGKTCEPVYPNASSYNYTTPKLEIDFWEDYVMDFTIIISIQDVNNNSGNYSFINGIMGSIIKGLVHKSLEYTDNEYNIGLIGFYTGFYDKRTNCMYDLVKGFIESFIDIFELIIRTKEKLDEIIEAINDFIEFMKDFDLQEMLEAYNKSLVFRASLYFPYDDEHPAWEEFKTGFILGTVVYLIFYTIFMIYMIVKGIQATISWIKGGGIVETFRGIIDKVKSLVSAEDGGFLNIFEIIMRIISWFKQKVVNFKSVLDEYSEDFIDSITDFIQSFKNTGKARPMAALETGGKNKPNIFMELSGRKARGQGYSDDVAKSAKENLDGTVKALRDIGSKETTNFDGETLRTIAGLKKKLNKRAIRDLDELISEGHLKNIGSWSDDSIKGLAILLKKSTINGKDVAKRILTGYSDDVAKATFKGINKGVIDPFDVDGEDLAKYIDDFYKENPFYAGKDIYSPEVDEHQLLRMISRGKSDIAVLKKGTDGYGWTKIKKKHITGEDPGGTTFPEEFGISDELKIQQLIDDSIKRGTPKKKDGYTNRWTYTYPPPGQGGKKMLTVVDDGIIITSYPLA